MEAEKKMAIDSHGVDSDKIHKIWREDTKENGIQKKMNEEEYDGGIKEIRRHLRLLS